MEDRLNPYFDNIGKPILLKSVIGYLDILGFKQLVKRAHESGEDLTGDLLNGIWSLLKETFDKYIKDKRPQAGCPAFSTAKVFSDNLIWAYPFIKEGQFEFLAMLAHMGHYQRELAVAGYMVRGGVAVGQIHVSDDVIFGMPLLEALATDCHGSPPRIVLCQSAIKYKFDHPEMMDQNRIELNRMLFEDSHGQEFLNYLQALDMPDYDGSNRRDLGTLKVVIESRIHQHKGDHRIRKKYIWTAKYFNEVCSKSRYISDMPIIRISGE